MELPPCPLVESLLPPAPPRATQVLVSSSETSSLLPPSTGEGELRRAFAALELQHNGLQRSYEQLRCDYTALHAGFTALAAERDKALASSGRVHSLFLATLADATSARLSAEGDEAEESTTHSCIAICGLHGGHTEADVRVLVKRFGAVSKVVLFPVDGAHAKACVKFQLKASADAAVQAHTLTMQDGTRVGVRRKKHPMI